MKKLITICLIFLIFFVTGCSEENISSQKNNPPDFRNVSWGMSMSDVKKNENEAKSTSRIENSLFYQGVRVNEILFNLSYDFVDDKLFRASYHTSELVNDNSYINSYESLKLALTEKYGKPVLDKKIWINENSISKSNPNEYGLAVAVGDLAFASQWETPTTIVWIILDGNKYENSLLISYDSKEYNSLAKEKEQGKL